MQSKAKEERTAQALKSLYAPNLHRNKSSTKVLPIPVNSALLLNIGKLKLLQAQITLWLKKILDTVKADLSKPLL